jgi:hypothetical protein
MNPPARYLPRAESAPSCRKHSHDKRPLFPKTGARSTTDIIRTGYFHAALRSGSRSILAAGRAG